MFKPYKFFALLLAFAGLAITGANASDLSAYSKVYIAEVQIADDLANREVRPLPRRYQKERPVSEKDLAARAEDLRERLAMEIGKSKTLVGAPGEDVLTVQATITELRSNRPTMADYRAEPSLSHRSLYAGGAAVDISFIVNGEEIANLSDDYFGSLSDPIPTMAVWGDAKDAFRRIARTTAKALQ